ncbi:MAG: sulfite exporter TauE/SafE family protein [Alphaproteobacteria bacterium]|nr:sulfite exporter TauE/SafE family protein [Alphaproteobacteria bacterium]
MLDDPNSLFALVALASGMAVTGLFSGVMAGLLGVGGGLVIVPVLFNALPVFGVQDTAVMKVAVATSLATIVPTSIISARKHFARGTMDVPLLRSLAPGLLLGALLGTALVVVLQGTILSGIFAAIVLLVAINMGFAGLGWQMRETVPGGLARSVIGAGIGGVSAVMGIGGGMLGVPVLSACGRAIRVAVSTASAFGLIIAVPATIGLVIAGMGMEGRPAYSLGWVSLIGLVLIAPASIIATPWGVRLAHSISPLLLKRVFAGFLALSSVKMAYSLLA